MSESTDAPAIDAAELAARRRGDGSLTVLDVRDRDEFERWHVTGPGVDAVQIPHQQFIAARVQGTTADLAGDLDEPVVVVCGVGEASAEVAGQLREAGLEAVNLAGGMAAWARHYEAVDLPCSTATVRQYHRPAAGCLAYLVVSDGEAAVVDPLRAFAGRYVADATERDADLRFAVDTHVHADHVSGTREVAAESGADVVVPEGALDRGLDYGERDVRTVAGGDDLRVGDATLEAVHLPGHTSELVGYRLADDAHGDLLFGGDTLFLESVARPDLEVAAGGLDEMARRLHGTLQRLRHAADDLRVAPGHVGEATRPDEAGRFVASVGALRDRVDLLGLDETAFVDRVTASMPDRPANYAEIIEINLGRERVDGERAFDLELGPNHCAAE